MASTIAIFCGPCEAQDVTKSAANWCPECEEGLCSDCNKHHSVSKATRSHGVISVENYKKLATSISEVVHHCQDHNMRHQHYCPEHDQLCCPVCVTSNHKACTNLMAIVELIKTSKSSTLLANVEQSLQDIRNNIDEVTKNRKENLSRIIDQRQKLIDEVKQFRIKINSHLDMLEQKIITELIAAENEAKERIELLLTQITKKCTEVDELNNGVFAIKEYASDLQTFYGSKAMEAEVVKIEKYVISLHEDEELLELNLKCNLDEKLSNMFSSFTTFGSVSVEASPSSVVLKTEKEKQAQIMTVVAQPSPNMVNDIKLTLAFSFTIPKDLHETTVRGCTVGQNGKIFFTDRGENKRLILLNSDCSVYKVIHFKEIELYDVTTITDTKCAISTDNGILIVNTADDMIGKCVRTGLIRCGISNYQDELLWCEESVGVITSNLCTDRTAVRFSDKTLSNWSYIASSGDNIYTTNPDTDEIICYQKNKKLWNFQNTDGLRDPAGIALDNRRNVYVASFKESKVVVISSDGKQNRTLLDQADGIKNPFGMCFDKVNNRLIVTNRYGNVYVYIIS